MNHSCGMWYEIEWKNDCNAGHNGDDCDDSLGSEMITKSSDKINKSMKSTKQRTKRIIGIRILIQQVIFKFFIRIYWSETKLNKNKSRKVRPNPTKRNNVLNQQNQKQNKNIHLDSLFSWKITCMWIFPWKNTLSWTTPNIEEANQNSKLLYKITFDNVSE